MCINMTRSADSHSCSSMRVSNLSRCRHAYLWEHGKELRLGHGTVCSAIHAADSAMTKAQLLAMTPEVRWALCAHVAAHLAGMGE